MQDARACISGTPCCPWQVKEQAVGMRMKACLRCRGPWTCYRNSASAGQKQLECSCRREHFARVGGRQWMPGPRWIAVGVVPKCDNKCTRMGKWRMGSCRGCWWEQVEERHCGRSTLTIVWFDAHGPARTAFHLCPRKTQRVNMEL